MNKSKTTTKRMQIKKRVKGVRKKMVERQRKFNACIIGVIKRKSIYIIWENFSEIGEKENLYTERVHHVP